jgi:2,4-dienoyl-CoA reductase-like NADH-dependent reductase (Old Yellow Enzyme family)
MRLQEIKTVCEQLVNKFNIDFLDISLWDCFKKPEETEFQDKSLLDHFVSMDFGNVLLTVAGQIRTADDVKKIISFWC